IDIYWRRQSTRHRRGHQDQKMSSGADVKPGHRSPESCPRSSMPWSPTERVSHDRGMRSAFDALEIVGIALGTARRGLDACDDRAVVVVERERGDLSGLVEMSRVARTHDDARHARLIEHPTERHRADPDAVARCNSA